MFDGSSPIGSSHRPKVNLATPNDDKDIDVEKHIPTETQSTSATKSIKNRKVISKGFQLFIPSALCLIVIPPAAIIYLIAVIIENLTTIKMVDIPKIPIPSDLNPEDKAKLEAINEFTYGLTLAIYREDTNRISNLITNYLCKSQNMKKKEYKQLKDTKDFKKTWKRLIQNKSNNKEVLNAINNYTFSRIMGQDSQYIQKLESVLTGIKKLDIYKDIKNNLPKQILDTILDTVKEKMETTSFKLKDEDNKEFDFEEDYYDDVLELNEESSVSMNYRGHLDFNYENQCSSLFKDAFNCSRITTERQNINGNKA